MGRLAGSGDVERLDIAYGGAGWRYAAGFADDAGERPGSARGTTPGQELLPARVARATYVGTLVVDATGAARPSTTPPHWTVALVRKAG